MTRKLSGEAPRTLLPKGSVDCHMHIYGDQYPIFPNTKQPDDKPGLTEYLSMQKWVGLERVVFVSANAHQTDNTPVLDGLAALGNKARGVGVVTTSTSEATLQELHQKGMRGARIMQLMGGAVGLQDMLEVNAKIAPLGWHNIVQFNGREMLDHKAALEKMQTDYVLDHHCKFMPPVSVDEPEFKALLELIDRGNCYVKLAGCYETSESGAPDYEDMAQIAKVLIRHAPERIIWGSNWPHLMCPPNATPDDAVLLDKVCSWAPDRATLEKIFVENPLRLYGFDA